jgi:hypothetical protein
MKFFAWTDVVAVSAAWKINLQIFASAKVWKAIPVSEGGVTERNYTA